MAGKANAPALKGVRTAKPSGGSGVVQQGQGIANLSKGVAVTLTVEGAVAGPGITVNSTPVKGGNGKG